LQHEANGPRWVEKHQTRAILRCPAAAKADMAAALAALSRLRSRGRRRFSRAARPTKELTNLITIFGQGTD